MQFGSMWHFQEHKTDDGTHFGTEGISSMGKTFAGESTAHGKPEVENVSFWKVPRVDRTADRKIIKRVQNVVLFIAVNCKSSQERMFAADTYYKFPEIVKVRL